MDEGAHRQHLRVLQDQRASEGRRGHRTGECEWGDAHGLARPGQLDQPLCHRDIQREWRVGVDDGQQRRAVGEALAVGAQGDGCHLDAVGRSVSAERNALPVFVE